METVDKLKIGNQPKKNKNKTNINRKTIPIPTHEKNRKYISINKWIR